MQKASLFLILLLLIVHASAQEEETEQVPPGGMAELGIGLIRGKVTDTQTPRPNNLADATITVKGGLIGERRVTTDAAGNYEVRNLPSGEYTVTASKKGYDESTDFVTVIPGGEAFHDVRLFKIDIPFLYTKPAILGFLIFPILAGIFWIWMLVDCATRESSEGNDKIVWTIIIIFASFIGALIYLFVRRPKRKEELGR
jgi:hypothetical protein